MRSGLRFRVAILASMLCLPVSQGVAGGRLGGDAEILYERTGAGGTTEASSGIHKMEGSMGTGSLPTITSNEQGDVSLSGFWKAEGSCTLYNPTITELVSTNPGQAGITFLVVNDNTYSVEYIDYESGGMGAGTHAITNLVESFTGVGGAGATTTIWHNVSASTNRIRFYLIRCE